MKKMHILVTAILCVCLLAAQNTAGLCAVTAKAETAMSADDVNNVTDYSDPDNWLSADMSGSLPVDVFYLYPTAWQKGPNDSNYCSVDNTSMIKGANGASDHQQSLLVVCFFVKG